ncbi:MAG: molybdenum cofactor guanylyltransferase [Planctomycetota bacterium]
MRWGGLVVCGGRSLRMGRDKANLLFGSEPLLLRMLRLLAHGLGPVPLAVAAAADQVLPALPPEVVVTTDAFPQLGPIEGLHAGLTGLSLFCDAVVVTSCDAPLLVPAVLPLLQETPGEWDAVVVSEPDGRLHPLCSAWKLTALPAIRRQRELGNLRLQSLLQEVRTVILPATDLLSVDPQLDTLQNINDPEALEWALQRAGLA